MPFAHRIAGQRPWVSVLVTGFGAQGFGGPGFGGQGDSLESLAAQTLPPGDFEVVVVHDATAGVREGIADFRERHPDIRLRLVGTTETQQGAARNVAIAASRGDHLTFVDDGDVLSPTFLEVLLERSAPAVLPLAWVGEAPRGTEALGARPDLGNDLSRAMLRHVDALCDPAELTEAFTTVVGRLVPAAAARRVRFGAHADQELVFWLSVLAPEPFKFAVTAMVDGARYVRAAARDEAGRTAPEQAAAQDAGEPAGWDDVLHRLDAIARIGGAAAGDPTAIRIAAPTMAAHGDAINRYLRGAPDDHHQVVDEVRRRGLTSLTGVPWSRINHGLARDLAVLYCFTPYLDTSALVAARRLRERGVVTDVISHDLTGARAKEPTSDRVAAEVVDVARVLPGPVGFSDWPSITAYAEGTLAAVEELEQEQEKGPYRTVYSRAMAANSHFAAAAVKLRRPELHWTAEFSDPMVRNPQGEDRLGDMVDDWLHDELRAALAEAGFEQPAESVRIYDWSELVAYALADELVFTNELQLKFMLGYCRDQRLVERVRRIARVSRHPTPPPDFYSLVHSDLPLDERVVNVAYFGAFYVTRGLTEVTSAIESLSAHERGRFRLHVFTARSEVLAMEVLQDGLVEVVNVEPYVPYLEFLNLATRCDVLLVNDANTAAHHGINPYLPSKLSDYRGSGTPVWAIHEPGSILSGEAVEYASALGDVDGAAATIRAIIRDHRARQETR